MGRRRLVLIAGLAASLLFVAVVLMRAEPLTEDRARQYAEDAFARYAATVGLDVTKFGSPKAVPAVKVPYGFEYAYADEKGTIRVIIWVDKGGWTDIAIDGDIERLYDKPTNSSPTRA